MGGGGGRGVYEKNYTKLPPIKIRRLKKKGETVRWYQDKAK